jgi:hypothetical protein
MAYVEGRVVHDADPRRRFDASLATCRDAERRAFFCDSVVDVMGPRLATPS